MVEQGTVSGGGYVLGHSSGELERLGVQARMLAPITRRLLMDAGVGPGMRVLDVGTGIGDVAFLATELVGDQGEVIGIDRSEAALATARERAAANGLKNVSWSCVRSVPPVDSWDRHRHRRDPAGRHGETRAHHPR